jgi:ABC-type phosphate/phosphonate transport system substrate-binding protein
MGPEIDYILYSNYDRQVQALLHRQIDIGWNTNLAWVKLQKVTGGKCRALAMRDVDANFTTVFVARQDSAIQSLADLRGKRIALGSADSGQAAILPIHFAQKAGVDPLRECTLLRFDADVGKHGDTGTSELDVLRALQEGKADAGALAESTWRSQVAQGRINDRLIQVFWTSPGYCHCNFSALPEFPEEFGQRWTSSLLAMSYEEPRWRTLMDQEGLKRWIHADAAVIRGYQVVFEAVEHQGLDRSWRAQ